MMKSLPTKDPFTWIRRLVLPMLLLSGFSNGFAQISVSGTVVSSEDNLGLIGVNVIVKGTTRGVVTDIDGAYQIEVPDSESILLFSYTGMEPVEEAVNGRSVVDIIMQPNSSLLDEVVVVGYGRQKKANVSGAADILPTEQLTNRPINNLAQGMQGLAPNLNIDFASGAPGQAARINIRGITSINGGDPLILIDGVPSDPLELNRLAPEDVANISILKDASSAAIYGARAAYGVILITTRTGVRSGVTVNYSNNLSWGSPTVLPEKITDPYIYMRTLETSTDNTPWDNVNYTDDQYAWAKQRSDNPNSAPAVRPATNDPNVWEYMGNEDWTEYFMSNSTFSQNHHLSVSGTSDRVNYYLSGSFNNNSGLITLADDYFRRYNLRGKVDFQVNDWLSLSNNTYLTTTNREVPTYFDIWTAYNLFPTDYPTNPDGTWGNNGAGRFGSQLTNGGTTTDVWNSLQTTIGAKAKILGDNLSLNADYTARRGNGDYNYFTTSYPIGFGPEDIREEGNNYAWREAYKEIYNVANIYLSLDQMVGSNLNISAVAGYNQENFRTQSFYAARNDLISASLPTIALATGEPQVGEDISEWAVQGIFARLNFTYADKYILEFNGRYDGSSRFPEDKRWGFFPSASAAWRIDRENFMLNQDFISQLKLRASYGSLGNQAVGNYGYIPTMSAFQGNYIIGGSLGQRVTPPPLVSSNYTWETVTTTNFGIDLGFLNDQFQASFDIYRRNTYDMLTLGRDLPDVLGAPEPLENAADLKTDGWELSLGYRGGIDMGSRRLNLNARVVLSDSRSEITRFDNPNGNLTQYYVGQELGEIWGLESDGLFETQDEIDALDQTTLIPWGALAIVPGWPKYVDQDNNGVIEKGLTLNDTKDLVVVGNHQPRYRYGITLGADFAGFDLNVFFQGVGKRDYYPLDYLYWGFYQQPYAGGYPHLNDYYRAEADSDVERSRHSQSYIEAGLADANTDAFFPVLQSWLADRNLGERIDQSKGLAIPQTRYMLDASYLRLKNLTLGYTLPTGLIDGIGLTNVRVFFSGENLLTWSEVADFYDPEAITDAGTINPASSPGRSGGKGYAYPFQRRYSVGVNVSF